MKEIRGLSTWLKDDKEMLDWVEVQLKKDSGEVSSIAFQTNSDDRKTTLQIRLDTLAKTELGREQIREIRKQWSKNKYFNHPKNHNITLTLDPNTLKSLDKLSIASSRRKTLELLIKWGRDIDKEMRAELQTVIKEKEDYLERYWPKKKNVLQSVMSKHETEKLEETIKSQQTILEQLLHENCEMTALLDNNDSTSPKLNAAQQKEAQTSFTLRLEYYKNHLKTLSDRQRAEQKSSLADLEKSLESENSG